MERWKESRAGWCLRCKEICRKKESGGGGGAELKLFVRECVFVLGWAMGVWSRD